MEYRSIEPARLIDSRTTGGKLTANAPRVVQVTGGVVPEGATAITGNLTITQPEKSGFASLTPGAGTPAVRHDQLRRRSDRGQRFHGRTLARRLGLRVQHRPAHFILDITGYFTA